MFRSNKNSNWKLLALILCTLPYAQSRADAYHYTNILVGDRAAGLGGAYVAVADDPTGLYYNPAGTVYAVGSNLSASMNALHITRTIYHDVLGDKPWVRDSTALLPNFFGVIQPFGPGVLGFSYAVPDSSIENQQQSFLLSNSLLGGPTQYNINFNNQDVVYNIGPSYALKLRDWLSIGLTLYGTIHQQRLIFNQVFMYGTDYQWSNSYFNAEELGLRPVFGVMVSPRDKFSIGATLSKRSVFYTRNSVQQSCARKTVATYVIDGCTNGELVANKYFDRIRQPYPWNIDIGAAYFHSSSLMLSLNTSMYENIYQRSFGNLSSTTLPLVNVAAGLEYYAFGNYAIRLGAYNNFSSTPSLSSLGVNQADQVDLAGFSLSLTNFTRSSSITGGFTISSGQGQAQVVQGGGVHPLTMYLLTMYMSASYSY